jgi:hypothetical protein
MARNEEAWVKARDLARGLTAERHHRVAEILRGYIEKRYGSETGLVFESCYGFLEAVRDLEPVEAAFAVVGVDWSAPEGFTQEVGNG